MRNESGQVREVLSADEAAVALVFEYRALWSLGTILLQFACYCARVVVPRVFFLLLFAHLLLLIPPDDSRLREPTPLVLGLHDSRRNLALLASLLRLAFQRILDKKGFSFFGVLGLGVQWQDFYFLNRADLLWLQLLLKVCGLPRLTWSRLKIW